MERFYSFAPRSEEEQFFDSREDLSISPASNSIPQSESENENESESEGQTNEIPSSLYQVWLSDSESLQQRRAKFTRLMGLDLDPLHQSKPKTLNESISVQNSANRELENSESSAKIELISEQNSANQESEGSESSEKNDLVPVQNSANQNELEESERLDKISSDDETISSSGSLSTKSSLSRWSSDKNSSSTSATSDASTVSDAGFDWLVRDSDGGTVFFFDGSSRDGNLGILDKFGSQNSVQSLTKKDQSENSPKSTAKKDKSTSWLRRLGIKTNILEPQAKMGSARDETTFSRVKVKTHKKNCRELSEVYSCQDFIAHDSSAILTLQFSPDGKYLATGGELGVVRVWSVADRERDEELDFDENQCEYFEIGENYKIAPLSLGERKESWWHNGNLTPVLVPKRMFWIEEEPLQDFKGHFGDVLDLSWSKSKYLISASVDKTVRLWQIGCENCLKIFSHQNYVTCVQFNPSNEDYFVSGSIDGIIRIWQVPLGHVVNWTESKEIVTAVCYQPDGMKVVVGTITGQCRFYDVSDNQLVLKSEVSLQGKKKSPHKRITGFEFCPCDSSKLMIASADSQIRILQGSDIITSYKGSKSQASQVCASFTSAGQHIISFTDDSIYLLNLAPVQTSSSFERFTSHNTSLAIPFNGPKFADLSKFVAVQEELCGQRGTGTATWPEEKLTAGGGMGRREYKMLKNGTDVWGQVVVTAGWDGRIRSYQNFGLPVQV